MKKVFTLLLFLGITVFGQTNFYWNGGGTDNNWTTGANWGGSAPGGGEILHFAGSNRLTPINDLGAVNRHKIFFDNGASSFSVSGSIENTFHDYGGAFPKIENNSSSTQTISFPIKLRYNPIELNPVSGDLILSGNINTDVANYIDVYTPNSKTLTLSGVISGSGGITLKDNGSNGTLVLSGANTYTGVTTINRGTLKFGTNGTIPNSDLVLASSGSFDLNGVSGSVRSLSEAGTLNGGTVQLGSATLTISGGWTDPKFQNSISGTGGNLVKNGTGKLELYGTQSFSGSLSINSGTLATQVNLSASVINLNSGGIFELVNNSSINELNFNGGTLTLNSKTLTLTKLTLQSGTSFDLPNPNISASAVEIKSGATFNVTNNLSLTTLTLNSGSTLSISSGKTLTVTNLVLNDGTNAFPLPTGLTATNITVKNTAIFNINSNFSFGSLTIETGGTANVSSSTLTMSGSLTNNGTLNLNGNKVIFSGGNTVSGTVGFADVDITGSVNFGANSTINGTLDVKAGGYIAAGNAPIYANNSTLKYSSGGTYGRYAEWLSSGGKGLPYNVQITNNTTVNLGANGGTTETRSISGSLTIDAGSALDMSFSGSEMLRTLTVAGNIINYGTLRLGGISGPNAGDLVVRGDFTNNGTFNCNNREVVFQGTSNQTISGTQPITFDYFAMNNSSGITLSRAVTIDDRLRMESGKLTLGTNTLTLNSSAFVSGAALSNSNMVVATGTGKLKKMFSATGSFTYPVGDASNYTPVTLNFTGGTFDGTTYADVNLTASDHPKRNTESANYLKRYWTIGSNVTSPAATITLNYVQTDVEGVEDNFVMGRWTGTTWSNPTFVSKDPTANTITANTSGFSDFTGGDAGSLPVELSSFNVAIRNGLVDLKWETKTEINNYGFEVERKSSTADWSKIGFVEGHGTSNSPKYYSYSDKPVGTGKFSYRLKQIDNDGQFEYSPVVEVLVDNLPNGFVLEQNYPNPFNPETSIRFALKEDTKATLKVFNTMGEEVMTLFDGIAEAGRYYDVKFSGNDLSSGFYIYKLVAGDHVSVKKMLLMK